MTRYFVLAQVVYKGSTSVQIPCFYLNGDIQGIVNEQHAQKIVEDILNPLHDPNVEIHATIMKRDR